PVDAVVARAGHPHVGDIDVATEELDAVVVVVVDVHAADRGLAADAVQRQAVDLIAGVGVRIRVAVDIDVDGVAAFGDRHEAQGAAGNVVPAGGGRFIHIAAVEELALADAFHGAFAAGVALVGVVPAR